MGRQAADKLLVKPPNIFLSKIRIRRLHLAIWQSNKHITFMHQLAMYVNMWKYYSQALFIYSLLNWYQVFFYFFLPCLRVYPFRTGIKHLWHGNKLPFPSRINEVLFSSVFRFHLHRLPQLLKCSLHGGRRHQCRYLSFLFVPGIDRASVCQCRDPWYEML